MLHLYNGDATAGTARAAEIPGEHVTWREALVCGPAPADLTDSEFIEVRTKHLSAAYDVGVERCRAEFRTMYEALASFAEHAVSKPPSRSISGSI